MQGQYRVCSNLNLSRALGDHRYKDAMAPRGRKLSRSEHVICGVPDVSIIPLNKEDDDFILLACDGIWDVCSNEEALRYVQDHAIEFDMDLKKVVESFLDRCCSPSPADMN